MKKHYLIILALLPNFIFAQLEIDTDWKTEINNIFEYLDKSKVSSGHLLDYAMEFTDITAYDGVARDTNYVDLNVVGNIYKTLYMAKTSTDTTHTPQYQKFAYDIAQHIYQKNLMEKNNIVLSGLLFEYQHLDTLALSQNRIRVINNRYYDKYTNGVWQNPYKTKHTMAVATSTNQSSSKTLKFMLPSNLFLSNISGQIATIEMNFDNGQGWKSITLDQYLTVNFTQNRVHDFTTRINLTNGQQMLSRTKFKIDVPDMYAVPIKSTMLSAPNKIRISEGVPFTSSYIGADLTIRRMTSGQITKPLIVVEGFDSGHITDPADEDGDTSINSFRNEIDFAGINLENLLFNNSQYDIIYVDWIKGTASMEDNSRILKQVIEWVNNEKTGTQPNVILGQSMGGVISRYTLAKWEQDDPNFNPSDPINTSPHDVRLFIAHDSPMQGANTPLSLQHFTRHVKLQYVQTPLAFATGEVIVPIAFNLAESVSDFINWFGANTSVDPYVSPLANLGIQDTPAARELNYWSLETWNHTQTQDYYDDWQAELNSVGYPLASRNVAISNGNECAEDHGFNPGDLLFKIDDVDNPDFFGDLLNMIGVPLLSGTRPLDFGLAIVGAIPGSSKWRYNFDFYATPLQGTQGQIYRGRIRYEKRVLWIGPKIEYDLTNRTFDSPSSALPYDSYAGGYFDVNPYECSNVNGQNVCDFDFAINLPSQVPPIQIFHRQYGFIPTVSALDIVKTNGDNPNPNDYLKTTSGGMIQDSNLESNFDSFIVDYIQNDRNNSPLNDPRNYFNSNNKHISFQARNGLWLAEELEAQSPADYPILDDCSYVCDSISSISGIGLICDSRTFTFQDGPDSVIWSIDPPNAGSVSVNTSNTNQVTVTRNSSYNGPVTLIANTISAKCGPNEVLRDIWFGGPITNQPTSISGPNSLDPGQTGLFSVNTSSFDNASSFNWVLFSNQFPNASQHFVLNQIHNGLFTVKPDFDIPGGFYSVQVRATNGCGFYPVSKTFYVEEGDGVPVLFRTSNIYKIYPNPSSTQFNISLVDKSQQPLSSENIYGELLDLNGLFMSRIEINDNKARVNANNLRKGIYILRIYYDGKSEGHQVIVE